MQTFDGLQLLVRAEVNFGHVGQISKHSGVPVSDILAWLDGGELSASHREALSKDIDPRFTGPVQVS